MAAEVVVVVVVPHCGPLTLILCIRKHSLLLFRHFLSVICAYLSIGQRVANKEHQQYVFACRVVAVIAWRLKVFEKAMTSYSWRHNAIEAIDHTINSSLWSRYKLHALKTFKFD